MSEKIDPPENCQWWSSGDSTRYPPEDSEFLSRLANRGFSTYMGEGGLIGAVAGDRWIDVIHRGRGKRWRIGFLQTKSEVYSEVVTSLPSHVNAAIAWLENEPLERVAQVLQNGGTEDSE